MKKVLIKINNKYKFSDFIKDNPIKDDKTTESNSDSNGNMKIEFEVEYEEIEFNLWKDIFISFGKVKNKYDNVSGMFINLKIEEEKDYDKFLKTFVKRGEDRSSCEADDPIMLKEEYKNTGVHFLFRVKIKGKEKIDAMLLHNFALLTYTCNDISLQLKVESDDFENEYRLKMYFDNIIRGKKARIFFKDQELKAEDEQESGIDSNSEKSKRKKAKPRKLLPALWVDKNILTLLQKPIDPNIWEGIVKLPKEVSKVMQLEKEVFPEEYINLVKACAKYIEAEEFQAANYTKLRQEVFMKEEFKKELLNIPFFALLIFLLYDNFYRFFLVETYKNEIKKLTEEITGQSLGKYTLLENDLKISLQKEQKYFSYLAYENIKKIGYDVKNLFSGDKDNEIHREIIMELFEAKTIAEGLLQIIENAVLHAGGGLLSMIIYGYQYKEGPEIGENSGSGGSRTADNNDNEYLDRMYAFVSRARQEGLKRKEFFLEVRISDISSKNMLEKFIENIRKRNKDKSELDNIVKGLEERKGSNIYELFFNPDQGDQQLMNEYYQIGDNQIFHFGLQIFDSIIHSKNGSFDIGGQGFTYNNCLQNSNPNCNQSAERIIKDFPGTAYRMLIPLKYTYTKTKSIFNEIQFFSDILSLKEREKYYEDGKLRIYEIECSDINDSNSGFNEKYSRIKSLKSDIEKSIEDKYQKEEKYIILVDRENCNKIPLEVVMKALLGYLISDEEYPPVVIVGLNSYEVLESIRILAMFYNRQGVNNRFAKMQFFIKGKKTGEEFVFAGSDTNKIRDYMKKRVLTSGLAHDYIQVADRLLGREQ